MNQEGTHTKIYVWIVALLLILITIGLLLWLRAPSPDTATQQQDTTSFSPFDRPMDRAVDTRTPSDPYTYVPTLQTPEEEVEEPTIVNSAPQTQSSFYSYTTSRPSFEIPSASDQNEEVVYDTSSGGVAYVSTYDTSAYYRPTYTYSTSTRSDPSGTPQDEDKTFKDLDKEVFGYISGLGWTQLLGDTGQQIYDILYGMSPNGGTAGTIGNFLPGAGGGGGGGGGIGGFGGGGGGGATMEFGGRVTRVTQCTCGSSSMLDIEDVRGQTVSLIYQPGQSELYREGNINGTGQNVLGTYTSGGVCLVYVGEGCESEGSPRGTIKKVGTSKQ